MKELFGDMWDLWAADLSSTIVVTTNGTIGVKGAIMGRGTAQQAAERFPGLRADLGARIRAHGNHVYYFPEYRLVTFPAKQHYAEPSPRELIKASVAELVGLVNAIDLPRILMPRPGCGAGQLNWLDVKPMLHKLDDRFTVVEIR